MGSNVESNRLTILSLCDRLQELLINDDMIDLPVVLGDLVGVTNVWVENVPGIGRVVVIR